METLSTPSSALISRIVKEVDFEDRFVSGFLHVRAGVKVVSLYRLEEVFMLLGKPYPQIDLNKLQVWISTVIKDKELAHEINQIIVGDERELNKILAARDMIGKRIVQCKQSTDGPAKRNLWKQQ